MIYPTMNQTTPPITIVHNTLPIYTQPLLPYCNLTYHIHTHSTTIALQEPKSHSIIHTTSSLLYSATTRHTTYYTITHHTTNQKYQNNTISNSNNTCNYTSNNTPYLYISPAPPYSIMQSTLHYRHSTKQP